MHTHPNDLVTVQLTPGRLEILEGSARTVEERPAGYVRFLPRDVPHSYVSADTKPFELVSVSIKSRGQVRLKPDTTTIATTCDRDRAT